MVARTMTQSEIDALCLPSAAEIADAVARIPQVVRGSWRRHDARPGSFLEVAPGAIRFFRTSAHLPDAVKDRALRARAQRSNAQVLEERALYRSPMALLTDVEADRVAGVRRETVGRRKITAWSARSRSRMDFELRRRDFRPLFDDGRAPTMVTLTLPGDWEALAPNPRAFKVMVHRFQMAYRSAWGAPLRGAWKMEFQRRGAPHLHILMTPPVGTARGVSPYEFRRWLSEAWARCVGAVGEERLRHVRAGTRVEVVADRYRDPHRIAVYFAKEGFADAKEYQNEVPQLWLDAINAGEHSAQFWGVWSLPKAGAVLQLDDAGSTSVETLIDPLGVSRIWANIRQHYRLS